MTPLYSSELSAPISQGHKPFFSLQVPVKAPYSTKPVFFPDGSSFGIQGQPALVPLRFPSLNISSLPEPLLHGNVLSL